VVKDCAYCPEMVIVPAGEFLMGSPAQDGRASANELPQHQVKIPRHFAIGRFEVTRKQFEAFLLATGRNRIGGCWVWTAYGHRWQSERGYRNPSFSQEDDHPVVCVSWDDAQAYAAWLSRTTLRAYRVPTEAEWEYAARAGSSTAYYFGEDSRSLCDHANGADQITAFQWGNLTCSDGVGVQTARVGRYQPNAFGLYDVLGNVSEWVQDCVNETYTSAPSDGSAWTTGNCSHRIIRGGAWDNGPKDLRTAVRGAANKQGRDTVGFRVARSLEDVPR